jgi:hypothetical protein
MCVIITAEHTTRIPEPTIMQAAERNRDGLGLAWIERGYVRWRKGLSLRDTVDLAGDIPTPYILHARIATVGGTRPELCHPFPVVRASTGFEVRGRNRCVLFHNGHFAEWRQALAEFAGDREHPDGPWSDSRALAYLSALYDAESIAEMAASAGQRVALLTTAGVQRYGQTWTELGPGVWASNTYGLDRILVPARRHEVYRDRGPAYGQQRFERL